MCILILVLTGSWNRNQEYVWPCMGWALGKWKRSRSVLSDSLQPHAHGILQARILEWVVVSFSRGSSQHRDWALVSHTAGRLFTVWARALGRYFQIPVLIFMYFCESHLCTCPKCRGDHSLPCPAKALCMLIYCGVTEWDNSTIIIGNVNTSLSITHNKVKDQQGNRRFQKFMSQLDIYITLYHNH